MALQYNGVTLTTSPSGQSTITTSSEYQPVVGSGASGSYGGVLDEVSVKSSSSPSWLSELIGVLPGLATGAAQIIAAGKSGQSPVTVGQPQAQVAGVSQDWSWLLWLLGGGAALLILFKVFGKK